MRFRVLMALALCALQLLPGALLLVIHSVIPNKRHSCGKLSSTSSSSSSSSSSSYSSISSRSLSEEDSFAQLSDDSCLLPGLPPLVRIEEAPSNSRRIFTGVDISASLDIVYATLTDYDNLQNIIPSLVKNEVVSRDQNGRGARLRQIGGAKVFPGVVFKAQTVLDVKTYLEDSPIPAANLSSIESTLSSSKIRELGRTQPLQRGVFPRPFAPTSFPYRDITMQNVLGEGDFDHYQGVWRMCSLPGCAPDSTSSCRLSYAVELKPKGFVPVALIEARIASDLKDNLLAIRAHCEAIRANEDKDMVRLDGRKAGACEEEEFFEKKEHAARDELRILLRLNEELREDISDLEEEVAFTKTKLESIKQTLTIKQPPSRRSEREEEKQMEEKNTHRALTSG